MIATTPSLDATALDDQFGMKTYGRAPVTFVEGVGTKLWDQNGAEYLDCLSGIAVCGLGHCHPQVTQAIARQAGLLVHVSNLFHTEQQPQLAKKLCDLTGMDRAFFCNSGTEANETAIKLARKWGRTNKGLDATNIVTLTGSFHGRTLGSLAATENPKYQENFQPLPGGFRYIEKGNIGALAAAVDETVCAIMLEPVQGEGGVNVLQPDFIQAARKVCDGRNALLIADEVQCGLGRTGKFLACEHANVQPDVVTLAKGIANGVPMGGCLARGVAATTLSPGDHGCTFGGNPLACATALAVLDTLERDDLLTNATETGAYFLSQLNDVGSRFPSQIASVRGLGLMLGIELTTPTAKSLTAAMLAKCVIVGTAGESVLRFLPPLIISRSECDHVVQTLSEVLADTGEEIS